MDKEKILSQNKKENLYIDEYEKHIKLQGKSFGLMFVLFICILILFIKAVCKEPYYDIMTIIATEVKVIQSLKEQKQQKPLIFQD